MLPQVFRLFRSKLSCTNGVHWCISGCIYTRMELMALVIADGLLSLPKCLHSLVYNIHTHLFILLCSNNYFTHVVVVLITVVQPFIISCSTLAICPATAKLYLNFPMRLLCMHGKPWWFCSTLILCVY